MGKVVPFRLKKGPAQQAKELQDIYEAALERKKQTGIDMFKLLAGDPTEREKLERIRRKNAMAVPQDWDDDE